MIKALRATLFTLSVLAVIGITYVGVLLVLHPQPIDPAEVAVLEQSDRMVRGTTGYMEPVGSTDWTLMPGFPYAVSLLGQLFGEDLSLFLEEGEEVLVLHEAAADHDDAEGPLLAGLQERRLLGETLLQLRGRDHALLERQFADEAVGGVRHALIPSRLPQAPGNDSPHP